MRKAVVLPDDLQPGDIFADKNDNKYLFIGKDEHELAKGLKQKGLIP